MKWRNNLGQATGTSCIIQIILLIIWGFIGDWLILQFIQTWFGDSAWLETNLFLRWIAGVILGKFAFIGWIIGLIVGAVTQFPIL